SLSTGTLACCDALGGAGQRHCGGSPCRGLAASGTIGGMEALTFLDRIAKAKPLPFYVLHGDESFLVRQATLGLRSLILGPNDDGFGLSSHPGDKATWAAVMDDVKTLPMLAPRKLVVVEQADPFVSRERARLEKFVGELPSAGEVKGVLVLAVQTW